MRAASKGGGVAKLMAHASQISGARLAWKRAKRRAEVGSGMECVSGHRGEIRFPLSGSVPRPSDRGATLGGTMGAGGGWRPARKWRLRSAWLSAKLERWRWRWR